MATMNISLPVQMKKWAESQVQSGQYGNVSDYVRDLIRRDQRKREKFELLKLEIEKGLRSGISSKTREQIRADALSALRDGS